MRAATRRHPGISAAIFTAITVVAMALRLGPDALTASGVFLTVTLGLSFGAGFYFG
jgi:hypothetical protein